MAMYCWEAANSLPTWRVSSSLNCVLMVLSSGGCSWEWTWGAKVLLGPGQPEDLL